MFVWRIVNTCNAFFVGADPGALWKKTLSAIRATRGTTLQTVPFKGISTVLWVYQKLPQSTVSQAFPSNKSYESKAGCNRTPATVLWVPLIFVGADFVGVHQRSREGVVRRNGRPQGCFGESVFSSSHLRFSDVFRANLAGPEKKRTLQKHPFGRPFPRTTPSPLLWPALILGTG